MTKTILLNRRSLLPKLFMLVMLLVGGGNNAWGDDDPNFELLFQKSGSETYAQGYNRLIKADNDKGVALKYYYTTAGSEESSFTGTGTYSSNTHFYLKISGSASALNKNGLQVASTKIITKVSFLICTATSGAGTAVQPILFGWEGTPSTTVDYYNLYPSGTSINSTPDNAQWFTFDLTSSDASIKTVELHRDINKNVFTYNGNQLGYVGLTSGELRIWGVKVWTQAHTEAPSLPTIDVAEGAVDGLTDVTIASTNAERIFYCWSDSEVAPEKGDAAYSSVVWNSLTTQVPNVTTTKYLHTYGYNSIGTSAINTREYNVTKIKLPAGLAYANTTRTANRNSSLSATLSNPNALTITYSITNNGSGSSINTSTGQVSTGSAPGIEIVTASSAATDDFLAGEASYKLIVKALESDIEPVSPGYVFVAEKVTNNGTSGLDYYGIYDNNHIFVPTNNISASNSQGSSTFSDTKSYLNCIELKSTSAPMEFKVDRPCKITFYANSVNSRNIKVGPTSNSNTYGEIGSSSSTTITIPSDGAVFLTGNGNSRYLAGFEVEPLTTEVTLASSGWSSYSFNYDLDFANATDESDNKTLQAYVLSSLTKTSATLTSVDTAPASTGVILKGTGEETYTIPVPASADAVGTNKLEASVESTTVEERSVYVVSGGQLKLFTGTEVPANKAYLPASEVPEEARGLSFTFDDDATTGISTVRSNRFFDGEFVNVAGQRVAVPSKGLYIVNGKKVIVK